jgi:hypothetical protein
MKRLVGTMSEQRMNSRIRTCVQCELVVEQTKYAGHLLSISIFGALISMGCKPALGSSAMMVVELPKPARKISLAGYVVRVNRENLSHNEVAFRVGIRFYAITPEGILLLKTALNKPDPSFA